MLSPKQVFVNFQKPCPAPQSCSQTHLHNPSTWVQTPQASHCLPSSALPGVWPNRWTGDRSSPQCHESADQQPPSSGLLSAAASTWPMRSVPVGHLATLQTAADGCGKVAWGCMVGSEGELHAEWLISSKVPSRCTSACPSPSLPFQNSL